MRKKKPTKKRFPASRPKPLYAYITKGSKLWAKSYGKRSHGSISKYIDQLIKKDMLSKASKIVKKARLKK